MKTLFALAVLAAAPRDEGMWTFHAPPRKPLAEKHGFEPTPQWLENVRLASVRINAGGSGSFVSPNGLVLTNHHVALDAIQKLSTPENDYVKNGFSAASQEQEIACNDQELNVLVHAEDVTARVVGAVKPGASAKDAEDQRKAEISRIESESKAKTGLRSNVVTHYQSAEYHLYRFKQYTDVRLVFAPEQQIAFFGGDPDNFTFPRYDLDFAFFRVYENRKPAETPHHFKWNAEGPKDGELVFVSGHPGSTGRHETMAIMEYRRDHQYPRTLKVLARHRKGLEEYSARGSEEERQAKDELFGVENSLKAVTGYQGGLLDTKAMAKKKAAEDELRAKVAADPKLAAEIGNAWDRIAAARKRLTEIAPRLSFASVGGGLAGKAVTIVRLVEELEKPNTERLPEFTDAKLDELYRDLYSDAPVYAGLEEAQLGLTLQLALEELGPNDAFAKSALGERSPKEVSGQLVRGTKLASPEARKALVEGGRKAVAESKDPMIVFARNVDPILRQLRKINEDEVQAVEKEAGARIAKARFAVYGKTMPPDADFTVRLSYGVARGYEEDTTLVPFKTTFYGLYERANAFDFQPPYDLPARYREREGRIALATPLNFVSTCDIIGGNSGSPTLNAKAELIGLIFDGNIQSLSNRFHYDDVDQRAVSVHAGAILEVLKNVYDAKALVAELTGNGG